MEQHPIPQQISSYQFRLVGDMTLKQFFQLAGGALFSLLFYASPLHPLIKWPFIIFFALLGVALAFLPFEERPLEKWIIAFFRSVYTPTLFSWQKGQKVPVFFQEEAAVPSERIIAPKGEAALNAYLAASPQKSPIFAKLEEAELGFLSKMSQLFGPGSPAAGSIVPVLPQEKKPEMTVPEAAAVRIAGVRPRAIVEERPTGLPPRIQTAGVAEVVGARQMLGGQMAQFSTEAAPPNPPTLPNTITGQIVDAAGKIIEGAILEIRDSAGRPVRALKSNMLGHFLIVTPLVNGRYEIITEKDGYSFAPITFDAVGEIIPPIAIAGKAEPKIVVSEQRGGQSLVSSP